MSPTQKESMNVPDLKNRGEDSLIATQDHLFRLLLEIDELCKKNDIEYFLDYGSVLGAVRHKGFIPWDDDCDIVMTEDNYNRFVKVCEKQLDHSKRTLRDVRIDRESPLVFGRYLDLESTRVSPKFEFWNPNCGQCIDIFYLLELPGDPQKKQEAIDLYYAYDEYANSSFRHYRFKTDKHMELYHQFCEQEKTLGKDKVLQMIEEKIFNKHYDDCDSYIVSSARKGSLPSVISKKYFETVHYGEVQGVTFPIAGMYVEQLISYYGDGFCMYPEIPKQHMLMSFTNLGCEIYVSDFMRMFDKEKLLAERQTLKHNDVEEGYLMTKWSRDFLYKKGIMEVMKLKKKLAEKNINLKSLLVPEDKEKMKILDELFEDYYAIQLLKSVRYWEVSFPLDDDLFYAAIFNLLYNHNDLNSVAKLMELKFRNKLPLSPQVQNLWNLVLQLRKIKAALIYKDYDKAEQLVADGIKKYPDSQEMKICELDFLAKTSKTEEELLACKKKAEALLERYPEDDQCTKIRADICWNLGDADTATELYRWLVNYSKNGLILLDIKEKIGE